MSFAHSTSPGGPLSALRRLAREEPVVERCGLCAATVADEHQHLIEPEARQLVCVCDPCAILFGDAGQTKYLRVPRRASALPNFHMTDAQWDELSLPIGLAFFVYNLGAKRVVALYPSPAGPMESTLHLDTWDQIVRDNPVLDGLLPEVEGLLVNRIGEARDYYIVPVDDCFKLSGLIRTNWRGLSGGAEVWKAIDGFFADLKQRARPRGGARGA